MKKMFLEFLNKPLIIKLPLIIIISVSVYYLSVFIYNTYTDSVVKEEIKNFKFEVAEIYFESRFDKRNYLDKYLVIKTRNSITKDQFDKMIFKIPQEEVRSELSNDKEIKIFFQSQFRKNISSQISVSFNGKNIYNYNFMNSIYDEEDQKKNPINEVNIY